MMAEGSSPLTRGKRVLVGAHQEGLGLIPAHAGKTPRSARRCPPRRAHPRSRGENEIEALLDPEQQGSSPLTRGKLAPHEGADGLTGLIPAHAGKTMAALPGGRASRAHPRSRGENSSVRAPVPATTGSSPLTRGKPGAALDRRVQGGLIPAHAGKTASRSPRPCPRGAHPRSRGENS